MQYSWEAPWEACSSAVRLSALVHCNAPHGAPNLASRHLLVLSGVHLYLVYHLSCHLGVQGVGVDELMAF